MPTYEYECENCKHSFDIFQAMKDKALVKCPACGRNTLRRLIGTGAGIIFKGSGFYQTDYRSDSYKKSEKSESSPSANIPKNEAKTEKQDKNKEKAGV